MDGQVKIISNEKCWSDADGLGGGGAHNEHSVKESQKQLKIRTRELRGVLSFTAILIERALCHFVRRKSRAA